MAISIATAPRVPGSGRAVRSVEECVVPVDGVGRERLDLVELRGVLLHGPGARRQSKAVRTP